MNDRSHSGKGNAWKWTAGILVLLIAALYAGWHFFKKDLANPNSKVVKPLLTEKLKKMVINASDSLYHIEYDRFDLNIDSGKGLITNFRLIPDTAVYKRLVAEHKAPNTVMHISTDSLILDHFGFAKTPDGRRFNIAGVVMRHPVIRLVNKRLPYNDTPSRAHKPPELVKLMGDLLQISSVQKLIVSNMMFTYVNQNELHEKSTTLKHLSIKVTDFRFDKMAVNYRDTARDKKVLFMKVKQMQIATPDSLYHINFDQVLFSPKERMLSFGQFSVIPSLSREAFYKVVKYDKDRIQMIFNQMVMRNIDINRFKLLQQIHIGTTNIGSSWAEVMNSYNWPRRNRPLRPDAYPHQKLEELAFDITIDTMRVHRGYFQYIIAARKSEEPAKLFLTNMESLYTNITNNTAIKKRKPSTVVRTEARLMGAGLMHTIYRFDLNHIREGIFSNTTVLGPMDGRTFNPLSKPLGMIEVKSANIQKMNMHIDANRYTAKGNVDLYYTDMKLNLLKHDDKTDTLKKQGVLSFLTNAFLPNDNLNKRGKFRKGPINITRDPHDSFFELLWKSSLDGLSSATSGFDQKKEKPNGNLIIKVMRTIIRPHKGISNRNKKSKH